MGKEEKKESKKVSVLLNLIPVMKFLEQNQKILASIRPITISDSFLKYMLSTQKVTEQIYKSLLPSLDFVKDFTKSLSPVMEISRIWSNQLNNISSLISQLEIDRDFDDKFGWLEAISLKQFNKLEQEFKENGEESIWNKFMADFNCSKTIEEVEKVLASHRITKQRIKILRTALKHHKNKDYVSSIPLFLTQIEGILWDIGIDKKIIDSSGENYLLDENGNILLNKNKNPKICKMPALLINIFDENPTSRLKEYTQSKVYSKDLRHPILHGRNYNYDNQKDSTRLILLLLMVVDKAEPIKLAS